MPTECSAKSFDFGTVEGRCVEAAFDAGAVTSDAGALLLGATDRTIRMMDRLASCFHDVRCPELIEHQVDARLGNWISQLTRTRSRLLVASGGQNNLIPEPKSSRTSTAPTQ